MRKLKSSLCAAGFLAMLIAGIAQAASQDDLIVMGKAVYLNKSKGNCVYCHQIDAAYAT